MVLLAGGLPFFFTFFKLHCQLANIQIRAHWLLRRLVSAYSVCICVSVSDMFCQGVGGWAGGRAAGGGVTTPFSVAF